MMFRSRPVLTYLGFLGLCQLSRFRAETGQQEGVNTVSTNADGDIEACTSGDGSGEEQVCKSAGGDFGRGLASGRKWLHRRTGDQCTLYLAESTIPGAGLGIYTGIDHEKGGILSGPDVVHLFVDDTITEGNVLNEYFWSSFVSGGYYEAVRAKSMIPGVGTLSNGFAPLLNAMPVMGASSTGTAEPTDAGRGAYSTYQDHFFAATRSIRAGEEIFLDYGEDYFRDRVEKFGMIPMVADYEWAQEKVVSVVAQFEQGISQEDWDAMRIDLTDDERKLNALPKLASDLSAVAKSHTAWHAIPNNPRTVDWLEENGLCLDLLERRFSDISHAGYGAFAKSFIPKGAILTLMPLLQLRRSDLDVQLKSGENDGRSSYVRNPQQQVLNYCLGHNESSMLLYPSLRLSNLINHDGADPNAELTWSPPASYHAEEWFMLSTDDILNKPYRGLMMHVVAKRDISPDEEVTLDYGPNWEIAWQEHLNRIEASPPAKGHRVSAADLNQRRDEPRTVFEQVDRPYPDSISTQCHYKYAYTTHSDEMLYPPFHAEGTEQEPPSQFDSLSPGVDSEDELKHLEEIYDEIVEKAPSWEHRDQILYFAYLRPCKIIGRQNSDDQNGSSYIVRIFNRYDMDEAEKIPVTKEHYVQHVPRDAIVYVDKPYTSDLHNPNAFRHEIGIPDVIFPPAWKDLTESTDSD
jgi:SET domain